MEPVNKDIEELYTPGSWFMFSKRLLKVMGLDMAVLVSYLLNCHKVKDGFSCIPVKRIEEELNITENQQRRIIKHLESLGFLETAKIGNPSKRHARVDVMAIHSAITKAVPEDKAPTKKKAKQPLAFGKTASKATEFDKKATTFFIENVLKANGRLKSPNYKKYLESFRLLREWDMRGNSKAKKMIKEVLQFYARNYKSPYIPRAVSADAFRKKFDSIYDYMLRHEDDDSNKGKNEGIIEEIIK